MAVVEKGENMRLIDADALAEHKFKGIADWPPTEAISWQRGWNDAIDTIIEAQPTVEVVLDFHAQTPRHGHWVDMGDFESCSVCNGTHLKEYQTYYGKCLWVKMDYCPHCGAKMDEVEK